VDPEPGEQVLFHGHPSWRSILGFYAKGFLLAVVAGAIAGVITGAGSSSVDWVIVVVLVVLVLVLIVGTLRRRQTTYTITSRRLTIDTGILARELHETRLERVQNVNCRQSLFERMMMMGTVDFDTAGGSEYDFKFRGVARPREIVRTVSGALRQAQHAHQGL
jgi:uncharacterized membrane protein YdbT with pleckstrin-like domain